MTLDLAAIPLALMAGVFGVLSPCVWPLVPVVTSSAAAGGRTGPVYLAAGLSLSFALAGTVLTWVLVSTGMDPEFFRYLAAGLLVFLAAVLLVRTLGDWVTLRLSSLTGRLGSAGGPEAVSPRGQFGVGALLGFVWLPCVGPTLGAAIALASLGQSMGLAFVVMLAYGVGTAGVLLAAGLISGKLLMRWRSGVMASGKAGKKILGWSLLVLGLLVITGVDKTLEAMAVGLLPSWIYTI
jgi:cytochrome c biogenesis protein CcdA